MITASFMPVYQLRPEFLRNPKDYSAGDDTVLPIDAPNLIASGSHYRMQFVTIEGFFPMPSSVAREQ